MNHLFTFTLFFLWRLYNHGASGFQKDEMSVFVMEGDSVTLHINVKTNQESRMKWYLNDARIAQISRGLIQICTDDQCKERFRDRLKVDHQTGSLTITNIGSSDTGVYKLQTIRRRIIQKVFNVTVLGDHNAGTNHLKTKSAKEGESVILHPGVKKTPSDVMSWYFNHTLIAEMTGDQSQICTDDECKERFRDRLKVDHQTGSLTITNTINTDSGEYQLQINSIDHHNHISVITTRRFNITVTGASDFDEDRVLVKEGDSVTLHSDVKAKTQDRIRWYFNGTRIAQVSRGLIHICTDDLCEERFRDRLKMDRLTGDLTITNIRSTDTGVYKLQIIRRRVIQKIFSLTVLGVSATEQDEMKKMSVMEGESVTFDPGGRKTMMTWFFNDIHIAEITGDQIQLCTDKRCDERFGERLELDPHTGSLTIRNARTEDSGLYKLQIKHGILHHHSIMSVRTVSVDVTDLILSSGLIAGVSAFIGVLLIAAVGAVVAGLVWKRNKKKKRKKNRSHAT